MTLYSVIDALKKIAKNQPNIKTVGSGGLYDFMEGCSAIDYSVFFVTQNTHDTDFENNISHFNLNLFVIDRLTDAHKEPIGGNELEAQSHAMETLKNIIRVFCERYDADIITCDFEVFTQKFKDLTAGAYAILNIEVPEDYICGEIYGEE